MKIELARVYDPLLEGDSYRILVDRLWPRGVKKADLSFDVWAKELAPSHELRSWFNHDPVRWDEFRERYFGELEGHAEEVAWLLEAADDKTILLLYGARDKEHNQAVALKEWIERHAAELCE